MERVPRASARVVPVCDDGSGLLLLEQDPAHPGQPFWGTIGGAPEPGETLVDAAVRELHEETGLVAATSDLTAPFHRAVTPFSWAGVDFLGTATFFSLRLPRDVTVTFDHLEPIEVGTVLEARWLTPDELAEDRRWGWPDLPHILTLAVGAHR